MVILIVYKDIFERLSGAGWSVYQLQKKNLISGSTMNRIRHGQPINTSTIDTICTLCECQPGDLLSWLPDEKKERN